MPRPLHIASLLLLLALICPGCDPDEETVCEAPDNASLSDALSRGADCPVVRLTGTTYEGSFEVSAGTTIQGNGAILTGAEGAVFRVRGGPADNPTLIEQVGLLNEGVGILMSGGGHAALHGVSARVSKGVGVVAEGMDGLALRNVQLSGTVTEETLPAIGATIDPQQLPIAGVFFVRIGALVMESVDLEGFAGFGAVFFDTEGRWTGGNITGCVGSGVFVEGATMSLEDLAITEGLRGQEVGFSILSAGLQLTGESEVTTSNLLIEGYDGMGILQGGATSAHTDLQILDNRAEGIWVQDATSQATALRIEGESLISGNRGAGIQIRDSVGLVLTGLSIIDTALKAEVIGRDTVELGDGLRTQGLSGAVSLDGLALVDNTRAGFLLDGTDAAPASFDLDNVTIEGARIPSAFGLVVQNFDQAPDLDAIEVEEDLAERDANAPPLPFSDALSTLASVAVLTEDGLIGATGLITETGLVTPRGLITETGLVLDRDDD